MEKFIFTVLGLTFCVIVLAMASIAVRFAVLAWSVK